MRKTGTNVELFNVPTYQCSILFNNMGSFNRKSEFQRPENLNKPITKGEKFNVADLSLLREFWRNNYAHVILTAEADSLPTDDKELLEDYGLVECHSRRSNDLLVHARIDSTGYVRFLSESSEEDAKNTLAAIFEVKFGKKAEEAITDSREQLIRFSLTLSLLHLPLKAVTSTSLRTMSCIRQNVFKTPKRGNR